MPNYHEEQARKLGLTILYSGLIDKLCQEATNVSDDEKWGDTESMDSFADETIVCDRDEGYLSAVTCAVAVASNFPGRKVWVFGWSDCGYDLLHIFAEDSVRAATKRLRAAIKKGKKDLKKAKSRKKKKK